MSLLHHLIRLAHPGNSGHSSPAAHALHMALALVIYIVACRLVMRNLKGLLREIIFAGFNLAGVYGFLFYGRFSICHA